MKKSSKRFIAMLLVLMFSMSMVVSAQEAPTPKISPEEKFNGFITELEAKLDTRFEEINANWSQNQAKRQSRNASFLEVVDQYAPHLSSQYETAFAQHDALHHELFTTRTEIRTNYAQETLIGLTALKADLFAQATAGEITWKDARAGLKTYLTQRKDAMDATKDSYQAAIAAEAANWEARVAQVKALHEELKAAIAVDDSVVAAATLSELYDYLLVHLTFDQFKLDTMNTLF